MADVGNNIIDGFTVNWSSISTAKPTQSVEDASLIAIYNKVEFSSAILLFIFSPITVFTNGLFLLALYQDSSQCFRKSPSTFFVAGLSIADFITGLLVEPSFAVHYCLRYFEFGPNVLRITRLIYAIGGTLSTIAISTSFVIVLAMSLSQYIAIRWPHRYKKIVTAKRVIRLVAISGLYFLAFSLLQFTGISRQIFLLLDVILHPTLISLLLIVVLILMRKAFQKHVSKPARIRTTRVISRPTSFRNEFRSDLEISQSSPNHPASQSKCSPSSSKILVSSLQRGSLLSHSSAQGESSKLYLNNITTKTKSVGIKLTPIERSDESSNARMSYPPCNRDSESNTDFHHIEKIKKIKSLELRHGKEDMIDDNVRKLHEWNQDMVEDEKENTENGSNNSLAQNVFAMGLKRLRDSFHRRKASRRRPPIERQFTIMSFYLSAILLLSSISHSVVFYVFLLKTPESIPEDVYVNIALRITDLLLFLKVLLDAFIYAWRLPAYRRSLVKTISCGRIQLAEVEDV